MAERKPYTTKTRQIILEYLKSQKAVTVSVADIEKYLKTEGIKVNTTTVYRYLDKLCAEPVSYTHLYKGAHYEQKTNGFNDS